jgi:GH18 family chitinase
MTNDLHGQWDYGNPNSFDQCDPEKCIRGHINLTETTNAVSMITKAGVANNKIFVGEASYERSFHMASDGCWGPMCDSTGSRTQSDAKPGRCTNTGGYPAYAEIAELQANGQDAKMFYDDASSSDIVL